MTRGQGSAFRPVSHALPMASGRFGPHGSLRFTAECEEEVREGRFSDDGRGPARYRHHGDEMVVCAQTRLPVWHVQGVPHHEQARGSRAQAQAVVTPPTWFQD